MDRRFLKRKSAPSSLYSYRPTDSLREAELASYKRLGLTLFLILVLSLGLYLWGIRLVAAIGSFWLKINPGLSTAPTGTEERPYLAAPRLDPLLSAVNDSSKLKVSGWAPGGSEVEVFVNEQKVAALLSDSTGHFEAGSLKLTEGENKIFAKIKTKENSGPSSSIQKVIFDKTPPKLEITGPSENTEITDSSQKWLNIVGKTEGGAIVTINEHQAILDLEGGFQYQYLLTTGENRLVIQAVDEAGNETTIERTVKFSPLPPSPTP